MRQQYHFRRIGKNICVWNVNKLIEMSKEFPVKQVMVNEIIELDEPYWYEMGALPTCRSIAQHIKLVYETDLSYPIILSSNSRVMDGMHRVVKAVIENHDRIAAVQFVEDPEPDYLNVYPDDLEY
jgi:hypothetical protein